MPRPSARERLLDCAEQLFAAHGFAAVSLRAINAEAGLSPAALHYHFGSKDALVEAILARRMPALMARRAALLDALEAEPDPPTARQVVDALVRPLAELLAGAGEDGRRYLRVLARLWGDGDIDPAFVLAHYARGIERLEPMLQRALPDLPVEIVWLRMGLAVELLIRALAARALAAGPQALEDRVTALIDFSVGALEAPSTLPPERLGTRPAAAAGDIR